MRNREPDVGSAFKDHLTFQTPDNQIFVNARYFCSPILENLMAACAYSDGHGQDNKQLSLHIIIWLPILDIFEKSGWQSCPMTTYGTSSLSSGDKTQSAFIIAVKMPGLRKEVFRKALILKAPAVLISLNSKKQPAF